MTQGQYEPRFDLDYARGRQGELFVSNIVSALRDERVEVKTDFKAKETGRVYVEYECWRRGAWMPSGIRTTEAEVWVFVLDPEALCIVVATDVLRALALKCLSKHRREETDGDHPTKGVCVPIGFLIAETRKRAAA